MKTYGEVKMGVGTDQPSTRQVVEFMRSEYKDKRYATVAKLDDGSFLISIENPEGSERTTYVSMWLSKESLFALMTNTMFYFSKAGVDLDDMLKQSMAEGVVNYNCSENLE